jgi:diguanylate cyclase (GGDEF)-like protein
VSAATTEARIEAFRSGAVTTAMAVAATAAYVVLMPGLPHRGALAALVALATVGAIVVAVMPAERLVHLGWGDAVLMSWSVASIGMAGVAVALDGPASPLPGLFVLPLIFSALAYPARMFAAVAVIDVVVCVATLAATGRAAGTIAFMTLVLLSAAHASAWHARTHARRAAALEQLSRTDGLTGCLNRRGFEEELGRRVARQRRHDQRFGLVLLDLDEFKALNDRLGHDAGDDMLRRVAEIAIATVRGDDAVCRVGGDEFAVLLEGADAATTAIAAERLRAAIGAHTAVSSGWAAFPHDADDAAELFRAADRMLYRDKRGAPLSGAVR